MKFKPSKIISYKVLVFLVGLFLSNYSFSQNCFTSKVDVNQYLSINSNFESSNGLKITFSDMGGTCSTGSAVFMNPNIVVLNANIARVTYTCVTISGYSVSFIVNCSNNTIKDLKDNNIFVRSVGLYDRLAEIKAENQKIQYERYKKFHFQEKFNKLDLTKSIQTSGKKVILPNGCDFTCRVGNDIFKVKPTEFGYIIDSNLYDSKDNFLGVIQSNNEYYFIDFIDEESHKARIYIDKVDNIYEDIVEKRTFTVGTFNIDKNKRNEQSYKDYMLVDPSLNMMCVLSGAIEVIKWHSKSSKELSYDDIPDVIEIDSSYFVSIENKITQKIPFNSFQSGSTSFKMLDSETFNANEWNGETYKCKIYAVDEKFLYLKHVWETLGSFSHVIEKHTEFILIPLNITNVPQTSKSYKFRYDDEFRPGAIFSIGSPYYNTQDVFIK